MRPGTERVKKGDSADYDWLSKSVDFRRRKGQTLRQEIVRDILKDTAVDVNFTDNLEELSKKAPKEIPANLDGKIAIIYFDGNKFTKIRSRTCTEVENLTKFSEEVQNRRKGFLKQLILDAADDVAFKNDADVRMETLLWGGDELEIVVPAWKGWDVVKKFFDATKDSKFKGSADKEYSLTHAGGVVFCSHKAPILQVKKMAHALADMVKDRLSGELEGFAHATHDIAHYLVLESFDMVGDDIGWFTDYYYGKNKFQKLFLTPARLLEISGTLTSMRTHRFPRNKLFDIVRILNTISDLCECEGMIAPIIERALSEVDEKEVVNAEIKKVIGNDMRHWYFLADLWDYAGGAV